MYNITLSTTKFISDWESKSYIMYRDSTGKPTIGIGHKIISSTETFNNKNLFTDTLTDDEVNLLFIQDLNNKIKVIPQIENNIKGQLNQNQVDSLCSFIFNEGKLWHDLIHIINRFSSNFSYGEQLIRNQWRKYIKAGGRDSIGLINRREAEIDLFFSRYMGRNYYIKAKILNGRIIFGYY